MTSVLMLLPSAGRCSAGARSRTGAAATLAALPALVLGAGLLLAGACAHAANVEEAQDAANRQTRAEINAKRSAVQKAYDEKVKDCRTRFVVTGCLEDAHSWRIEALRPLQQQEIEVNARERQQRAAAQRERVMAKDQEAREAASGAQGARGASAVKAAQRPASAPPLPPTRQRRANPEAHQQQVQREQQAAERKAAERRQAAASREAKQQELQRRAKALEEKRAAKPADPKKPAPAHLPTPSASDIQSLPSR